MALKLISMRSLRRSAAPNKSGNSIKRVLTILLAASTNCGRACGNECVSVARTDINNIMAGSHTEPGRGRQTKAGYTVAASYEKDDKAPAPARVRQLLSTWPTNRIYTRIYIYTVWKLRGLRALSSTHIDLQHSQFNGLLCN